MGFVLQAAVLQLLAGACGVNYLLATALAVEAAVVHNFFWHEWYTWRDRSVTARSGRTKRLLTSHATTGSVSIGGNLALMALFVGCWHAPLLAGSLAAIAVCAAVNFMVNDRLVFRSREAEGRVTAK